MTVQQISEIIDKYKFKAIKSVIIVAVLLILLNLVVINYIYTGSYIISYAIEIAYASIIINLTISLLADMFKKVLAEVLDK